jgi:hypothetical protein
LRGDHSQDISIAVIKNPVLFVQGFQHTNRFVLDAHGDTQKGMDLEIHVSGHHREMARIVLYIRQADDLVLAEDSSSQTVIQRDGGFREPLRVGPGGGCEHQAVRMMKRSNSSRLRVELRVTLTSIKRANCSAM